MCRPKKVIHISRQQRKTKINIVIVLLKNIKKQKRNGQQKDKIVSEEEFKERYVS